MMCVLLEYVSNVYVTLALVVSLQLCMCMHQVNYFVKIFAITSHVCMAN